MSDKLISDLTASTAFDGSELIELTQDGSSVQGTIAQVLEFVETGIGSEFQAWNVNLDTLATGFAVDSIYLDGTAIFGMTNGSSIGLTNGSAISDQAGAIDATLPIGIGTLLFQDGDGSALTGVIDSTALHPVDIGTSVQAWGATLDTLIPYNFNVTGLGLLQGTPDTSGGFASFDGIGAGSVPMPAASIVLPFPGGANGQILLNGSALIEGTSFEGEWFAQGGVTPNESLGFIAGSLWYSRGAFPTSSPLTDGSQGNYVDAIGGLLSVNGLLSAFSTGLIDGVSAIPALAGTATEAGSLNDGSSIFLFGGGSGNYGVGMGGTLNATDINGVSISGLPDGALAVHSGVVGNAVSGDIQSLIFTGTTSQFTDGTGAFQSLPSQTFAGTKTATGTATTTFTVTIGHTMANTNYAATAEGSNLLSSAVHWTNNKTTTTFDVVYATGLTGAVVFDWTVTPYN